MSVSNVLTRMIRDVVGLQSLVENEERRYEKFMKYSDIGSAKNMLGIWIVKIICRLINII